MIYFHKSKEILKEEHLEKDVLQITDLEHQTKKILELLDIPISEYEKYLIIVREEFMKDVNELSTLPKL